MRLSVKISVPFGELDVKFSLACSKQKRLGLSGRVAECTLYANRHQMGIPANVPPFRIFPSGPLDRCAGHYTFYMREFIFRFPFVRGSGATIATDQVGVFLVYNKNDTDSRGQQRKPAKCCE